MQKPEARSQKPEARSQNLIPILRSGAVVRRMQRPGYSLMLQNADESQELCGLTMILLPRDHSGFWLLASTFRFTWNEKQKARARMPNHKSDPYFM